MTPMLTRNTPIRTASRTRRILGRHHGTVMLEFMLILPMFIFLALFSVDMGRMALVSGTISDAAYVAARSGAQHGGADPTLTRRAFNRAADSIPGVGDNDARMTIEQGRCNSTNSYIVVRVEKDVGFITPGLDTLLTVMGGNKGSVDTTGDWTLTARGTVLCEVIR